MLYVWWIGSQDSTAAGGKVLSQESLIASQVYSRRLEEPPTTWPALVAAILLAMGLTVAYSVGFLGLRDEAFDFSDLINTRFVYSLVPCSLISLGVWALLYFGVVRRRHAALGPIYFNILAVIVFATSLLAPVGMHGYRYGERMIAEAKARDAWRQAPGLKGELATLARDARQADMAAWQAIAPRIREADGLLDVSPSSLTSQAAVDTRHAKITKASAELKTYYADYDRRLEATRLAVLDALARNKAGPLVVDRVRPLLENDTRDARARRAAAYKTRLTAYSQTLDALDILVKARGTWKSEGSRMLFYRQGVVDRLIPELNEADRAARRLAYIADKASSPMLWSRPPPGV